MQFVLSFECWAIAKFRCNDDGVGVTPLFTCLARMLKCVVRVLRTSDLNPTNLLFSSFYYNLYVPFQLLHIITSFDIC